jgi:CBS domain-containing protein
MHPVHPAEACAVLIRAPAGGFAGFVTDRAALSHIARGADARAPLARYLTNALGALGLPSLYLFAAVVSVRASASVLDAMRRMSEDGVSSVAVLEENSGALLSAVSVTDIGKVGCSCGEGVAVADAARRWWCRPR